jgi:hypothetical protein
LICIKVQLDLYVFFKGRIDGTGWTGILFWQVEGQWENPQWLRAVSGATVASGVSQSVAPRMARTSGCSKMYPIITKSLAAGAAFSRD